MVERWHEIERAWPRRSGQRGFEGRQRSYVEVHPPHLLSGALRCGVCGGAIGQVSGKNGGYYGCLGASKHACGNRLLVPRRLTERKVLAAVREQLSTPTAVQYILGRVEAEVQQLHRHLPEETKLKRAAVAAEERRITNFIGFIGEGKGTPALADALRVAEQKAEALRRELLALEGTANDVFRAPPVAFDAAAYETRQVFYTSKDGTRVPMFITAKKGIQLDGSNPTLLYAYGGFNISMTPTFSAANIDWMEMGGIYALANLRGGGEYGKDWHEGGMLAKKIIKQEPPKARSTIVTTHHEVLSIATSVSAADVAIPADFKEKK